LVPQPDVACCDVENAKPYRARLQPSTHHRATCKQRNGHPHGGNHTAAPTTQWVYSRVSRASLQKTRVFLDFGWRLLGILDPKSSKVGLQRLLPTRKARVWRLSHPKKEILSNSDCLAGDAVLIAPSPREFPANREFCDLRLPKPGVPKKVLFSNGRGPVFPPMRQSEPLHRIPERLR